MTTKEYLSQIGRCDRMINNKLLEISQLRELACSVSAVKTGEKVKSTPNFDKMTSDYIKIEKKEKELDEMIDKYLELKSTIIKQISTLENKRYRKILYLHYVKMYSIHRVAIEIGIKDRWCKKEHAKAIEKFEKKHKMLYFT